MKEYEFTLKFALPDADANPQTYIDNLMEAGCDDALIGLGTNGRIALDFIREAESAMEAILSAISDVQKAIPKATLIECGPDLVGVSGIASIFKVSRQAIQKMVKNFSDTFPAPVHSGTTQIWHLIKILKWSNLHAQKHVFDETLFEIASASREVNVYKEISELERPAPKNITRVFPKAERILELH
ncbi:MAG: DNA-binding protein [Marinomonas sp.]|uniref:DNA-binding protein n=1 Tax=Marinomonas sp. TaxID=1904862 RepID=UPI003F991D52